MFVIISLAITPLRRIARYGALVDVRRMIGVGAFCYAVAHILFNIANEKFNVVKVATEIVLRLYLTIGFISFLGLTALAVTSTDGMVRRLGGRRWQRLHQLIYVIVLLALHPFLSADQAQRLVADPDRGSGRLVVGLSHHGARQERGALRADAAWADGRGHGVDVHLRGDGHRYRVQRLALAGAADGV